MKPIYGDARIVWRDDRYELIELNKLTFFLPQWHDCLDIFSEFSKDEFDYVCYNCLTGYVDLMIKKLNKKQYRVRGGNWDSDFVEVEI